MRKLLFTVVIASCFSSASVAEERPLRLGVIQSTTGIAAEWGNTARQSIELAVHDANAGGRKRVELFVENDESNPRSTVTAYQKLKLSGVDAVIGPTWSFLVEPVIPLAARDKLVVFSSTVYPEAMNLTLGDGYVFANLVSAKAMTAPFDSFLRSPSCRRLSIVYTNNSYGEALRKSFGAVAAGQGVEIVETLASLSNDNNEWGAEIPRLKSKQSECVALLLNRSDIELFLRRASEMHLVSRFFTSQNGFDALRLTKSPQLYEGVCFPYPLEQLRSNKTFSSRYESQFGEKPRIGADSSYDAVFLLLKAFEESGVTKTSLRDQLRTVSHGGIAGEYRYSDETSFSTGSGSLVCIEKGEMSVVGNKIPANVEE